MGVNKTDLSSTAAGIADLLGGVKSMDDYQSLMKGVFKRVAERALQAEMTQHLGYDKHAVTGKNTGNSRNGASRKTIIADDGDAEIDTPRDRDSSFHTLTCHLSGKVKLGKTLAVLSRNLQGE